MATLVKRNKREKKKSKSDKSSSKTVIDDDLVSKVEDSFEVACTSKISEQQRVVSSDEPKHDETTQDFEIKQTVTISNVDIKNNDIVEPKSQDSAAKVTDIACETVQPETQISRTDAGVNYNELSTKLDLISLPKELNEITKSRALELENPNAYLRGPSESQVTEQSTENIEPSAPIIEGIAPNAPILEIEEEIKLKIQCMPLEEAVKLYSGKEIAAVKAMSEREEAIVEAGPVSGPEHPLVDLLSTFRISLMSLDRERVKLASGFADEDRTRAALWRTEKRQKLLKQSCRCGAVVDLKIMYDYSEFDKGRLPAAKMKLQKLLRDVQESYCHHQHAALLTHYQIDITISDIIQSNKADIREALFLVLQALKMSDGAPDALPIALVRWAGVLAAALMDGRDLGQLLFLMHLLFRQTRSVRWASLVVHVPLTDGVDAARILALLDILLNNCKLETAVECSEGTGGEDWEEVSMRGAGAVSEGTLRERDLLALFNALPLREMVAKILLFNDADIKSARVEWWGDTTGGNSMLRSCCGVRTLLSCLRARPHYARLRARLRTVAAAAMKGLACLYHSNRKPYEDHLKEKIIGEMEACFATGFTMFDKEDLIRLPTSLLSEETARDYCLTFISGLHEKVPKLIESLNIEAPVVECATRVRLVSYAAADRTRDHDLARIVLDFLFQIGIKKKIGSCKGGCEVAARESMEILLKAHPYLHPVALRIMADVNQVEQLDPQVVNALHVDKWRPSCDEMQALLRDWMERCPTLLPQLLLHLDYTPFSGLPLDIQVHIGEFLSREPVAQSSEWGWSVLRRLRTHRVCWRLPLDAPAPGYEPVTLFDKAFALVATSWGHSIPMICSVGVTALAEVTRARPADGAHCAALVMLVMASSPESVSLTPKFGEVFASLASQSPSLLSRALGRAGLAGTALLQRLVFTQLEGVPPVSVVSVFPAWVHALWSHGLRAAEGGAGALAALEAAAVTARDWTTLHAHAHTLMQDPCASALVTSSVRHAYIAPLLCEVVLRSYHAQKELATQLFPLLLVELNAQRMANKKIHVDNALQKIGASISSDELCIYRCASAAMAAPLATPAHLALWTMFFHLYLQRPHPRSELAVGPLFFSGLIKTRMLSQMKRKLLETVSYHHQEAIVAKMEVEKLTRRPKSNSREKSTPKIDSGLFPPLTVKDLTGESKSNETESDDSDEGNADGKPETSVAKDSIVVETKHFTNMATYHSAAERLITEYVGWLEAYDKVKALPHHADLARVVPDYALEEAWKLTLSNMRPTPSSEVDDFPRVADPAINETTERMTPFDVAVNAVLTIRESVKLRSKLTLKSHLEDIKFDSKAAVVSVVEKHYKDIEKFAKEWSQESDRVVALDFKLWDFVSKLKMARPIAPIRKNCVNKCRESVLFIIEEFEYLTNSSVDEAIKENRESSRQAIRRLSRAKPHVARAVAQLMAIVKRIRSYDVAWKVLEMTWRVAGACDVCPTMQEALTAVFTDISQQWMSSNGQVCAELIRDWCRSVTSPLQQTLIGSLVAPRSVPHQSWPPLYISVITANLPPHIVFSCLSKFEMSKWMQTASEQERRELLKAIVDASQRNGPTPHEAYGVVLELAGVHAGVVATPQVLPELILQATKAAIGGTLPLAFWPHVTGIASGLADNVHFDQLGHLLRSLGSLWDLKAVQAVHVLHAPHVASLLHVLVRAFVHAATALSYEPSRVGWYAWGALLEAWSPWLVTSGPLASMLPLFVDAILQIMTECPGGEIRVLQLVFEWAVQTRAPPPLRTELARLPWDDHQWFSIFCLQFGLQMCSMGEDEFTSWARSTWCATKAETLVQLVPPEQLAHHLANLLHLFTYTAHYHSQFLEEGTRLPWWQLPDQPFGEALDRFFLQRPQPTVAYHDLSQFRILVFASELKPLTSVGWFSRAKRSRLISQWSCSAASPARLPLLTSHVHCVLDLLTQLSPHVETVEEMEEYVSRALIIMNTEPSGAHALQLWCDWIPRSPCGCVRAAVVAAASLTVPKYAAKLADVAVKALLLNYDGWDWIIPRWQRSTWRNPVTFVCRDAPHAAYAAAAHTPAHNATPALLAIHTCCNINFVEDEVIVAVWICYACRVMLACLTADPTIAVNEVDRPLPPIDRSNPEATSVSARPTDAVHVARRLLRTWAAPHRRSLLKMITLKVDTDVPTPQHRLLCSFGQCTIDPCPANVAEYEAACSSVLAGAANELASWGPTANLTKLLALATKIYPNHIKYFQLEIDEARKMEGNR